MRLMNMPSAVRAAIGACLTFGLGFTGAASAQSVCGLTPATLSCTANDFQNINVTAAANTTCVAGTTVSVPIFLSAANQGGATRYDIALAVNPTGGGNSCQMFSAPVSAPWSNQEGGGGDGCGDLNLASVVDAPMGTTTVTCMPTATGGIALNGLLAWGQNPNALACPVTQAALAASGPKCAFSTNILNLTVLG